MKKIYISFLLIFVIIEGSNAFNNLRVHDPLDWISTSGKIENAVITISPKGLFFRCDLEMTISTTDPEYFHDDAMLEIEYYFDLPDKSMIIESYLWIGDSLVRADLRDIWSANAIYESIVSRRKDPSVLYKRGNNNYELRVYPMNRYESRTVIISFLVPSYWINNKIAVQLPIDMLNQSLGGPNNLNIIIKSDNEKNVPEFVESGFPDFTFGDFKGGVCWYNTGIEIYDKKSLSVAWDSPLINGQYLLTYPVNDNEGFYQLALLPSSVLTGHVSSKVLILIDYDVERTSFTKNYIFDNVKNTLINSLSPVDSFNLVYSKLNPATISENWIPADSTSIVSAFDSIDKNSLANYSLLPVTLAEAIEYVDRKLEGEILIITPSNEEGSYKTANLLINDLLAIPSKKPVIHGVNISNFHTDYFYQNGYNYYGDEYFLSVLTSKTGGNYFSIKDFVSNDITSLLNEVFVMLGGTITNTDLYSDCENGFCYSKYFFNDNHEGIYINNPILQVGKYVGKSPFTFLLSGMFDGIPFSETKVVDDPDILVADESLETLWAGLRIDNLESGTHSNELVNEIINVSLDNHVMSMYTAFLALEPNIDPEKIDVDPNEAEIIIDRFDEWDIFPVAISEETEDNLNISIIPNPFNQYVEIHLNDINKEDILDIRIVNIMGQTVKTFNVKDYENVITWNGINNNGEEVIRGVYFIILHCGEKIYKTKLIKY